MSEDQFNVLKEMVAHLAEHITTEVGALRQEMRDGFSKVDKRIDDSDARSNRRFDLLERRQNKSTADIQVLQVEVGEIRDRLDSQHP